MKKPLSGLIALAVAAVLFTGCAPYVDYSAGPSDAASSETDAPNASAVSLKVWSSQMDQATLKNLCEEFVGKTYNIGYNIMTESDAKAELLRDPAAGADIFAFSADQLEELADAGVLLAVNNPDDVRAANSEYAVQAASADGTLYAYPASVSTYYLYYDLSKLREEELQSIEGILERDTGAETNFAMDFESGYYTSAFFYANGCNPFGGQETVNGEAGLAAAKALLAVASHPKTASMKDDDIVAGFREGKLAAAVSGSWNAEAISSALGSNYACAKLPTVQIDGEDKQLVSLGSFRLFGVNANTQHPEEALALADRLASGEGQRTWLESNGLSPTNQALLQDEELMSPAPPEKDDSKKKASRLARKGQAAIAEQGAYTAVLPSDPQLSAVWDAFRSFGQDLLGQAFSEANLSARLDQLATDLSKSAE